MTALLMDPESYLRLIGSGPTVVLDGPCGLAVTDGATGVLLWQNSNATEAEVVVDGRRRTPESPRVYCDPCRECFYRGWQPIDPDDLLLVGHLPSEQITLIHWGMNDNGFPYVKKVEASQGSAGRIPELLAKLAPKQTTVMRACAALPQRCEVHA